MQIETLVSDRQGRHFYFLGVIRKFDSASIWAGEELGLLCKIYKQWELAVVEAGWEAGLEEGGNGI